MTTGNMRPDWLLRWLIIHANMMAAWFRLKSRTRLYYYSTTGLPNCLFIRISKYYLIPCFPVVSRAFPCFPVVSRGFPSISFFRHTYDYPLFRFLRRVFAAIPLFETVSRYPPTLYIFLIIVTISILGGRFN